MTGVLGIVEGELVKVLKLGTVSDFPLQTRQLLLQFVQRITAAKNQIDVLTSQFLISLLTRLTPWRRALVRTPPW